MNIPTKCYRFEALWQGSRWMRPAFVGIDTNGAINYLSDQMPSIACAVEAVHGMALPGFRNAHSHAFQYAMAGLAEQHASGERDDFWSWRETMYQFALQMNPDQVEAVAAGLYAEMLRYGYTHVAEFHYLHHSEDGRPYDNHAEMGERLVAAAKTAGIKITLIPIFYQCGNFGQAPQERQRRFISRSVEDYLKLLDHTANVVSASCDALLGFGVHSLRAVEPESILKTLQEGPSDLPFHLHIAEQQKEVADCLAFLKKRPIEWLAHQVPLDERMNLVHCTHLTDDEVTMLAQSDAQVVVCPSTEANLGDGIFPLSGFLRQGGTCAIGTDSHIGLGFLEELRWLDYAQRLITHHRNTVNDPSGLLTMVDRAGANAMQLNPPASLETGSPLDAVVINAAHPLLQRNESRDPLPSIVYALDSAAISGTLVNGRWLVKNQIHERSREIWPRFRQTIRQL